ncbi:MAG: Omp28-related outer membrane protein [Flavobacteriaceae bacterium]
MKRNKLLFAFTLLLVAGFFVVSCSSDDNGTGGDGLSSITLKANTESTTIGASEQLTFTVTGNDNTNYTSSSIIKVNGTEIIGNTFSFEEAGNYSFVASYDNLTSNELSFQVYSEHYTKVSKSKVLRNETVTFNLLEINGDDVTDEATFFVNGNQIAGNEFSSETAASYEVYANYGDMGQTETETFEVFIPKRKVSFEDYTGTWCGWCPRVTTAVQKLKEQSDDVVIVALHNDAHMPSPQVSQLVSTFNVQGYPAARLNRTTSVPSPEDSPNALNFVLNQAGAETNLSIAIDTELNGNDLSVTARVISEEALSSDYKVVVYLTQNGLIFPQENYYHSNPASPWYQMGATINDFVHDDVMEASLTNIFGDPIVDTPALEEYTVSFDPINLSAYGASGGGNFFSPSSFNVAVYIVNQNNVTQNAQHVQAGESVNFE